MIRRPCGPDRALAVLCTVLAVAMLLLWLPYDIETGLIEKVRGRVRVGDALLPTVGLGFVLVGAALAALRGDPDAPTLTRRDLSFAAWVIAILATSLALMRWMGPVAVSALEVGTGDYRELRDSPPWKYLGFLLGGTVAVAGLMALVQRRLSIRATFVGIAAALLIALLYDLPFEDLLLPPNGDV